MRNRRLSRSRVLTILAALSVGLGGGLIAGQGVAPAAPHQQRAASANRTYAIVGNAHYLVYALATSTFHHQTYYARSKSGHTWKLPDTPSDTDYSISHRFLVSEPDSGNAGRWWNLATHKHGVIASGNGVGAAPHGWLVYGAHGALVEVTPSGSRQVIARPPSPVDTELSGPAGMLLYTDTHMDYVQWAKPGHLVKLKIDLHGATDPGLSCDNLNSVGAGCAIAQTREVERLHPELVRLNGNPPTSAPAVADETDAYIVGHALAWDDPDHTKFRSMSASGALTSFPAGKHYDTVGPVAAYGQIVLVGAHTLTLTTASYTDPKIIVDAADSARRR
jgi:hypothetical protein